MNKSINQSGIMIFTFIIGIMILSLTGCYSNSSAEGLIQPSIQQTNNDNQNNIELTEASEVAEVIDTQQPLEGWDVLEVYTAYPTNKGVYLNLINHDKKVFVDALVPTEMLEQINTNSDSGYDSENNFKLGDLLQIVGDYKRSVDKQNVTVVNIQDVHRLGPSPARAACESIEGREWRLEGMAQTPMCITSYSDAGKSCQSSDECQGSCRVRGGLEDATCASSNSYFGCGASIEDFRETGSIICID